MAEIKIDCPICFDTHQCFEDTVENRKVKYLNPICVLIVDIPQIQNMSGVLLV